MAQELKSIEFKQLGEPFPGAEALRVVRHGNSVFLVASRTRSTPPVGAETLFAALDTANPGAGWRTVTSIRQIVPAQPAWDMRWRSAGQFDVVYEKVGGAINSLVLLSPSRQPQVLTAEHAMHNFSQPRFVKSSSEPPAWVTAIMDNRNCVVVPLTQAGSYRDLGECGECLVVKNGSPLLYFAKKGVAGEVRGNSIAPGRLQASKLDPDFRQPIYPIEVAPGAIFQFDAEVLGGKIVVVATTGDGIVVASSPTAELHFTRKSYGAPPTLTSPVILPAVTGSITVCALDGEGTSSARVLVANVAIP